MDENEANSGKWNYSQHGLTKSRRLLSPEAQRVMAYLMEAYGSDTTV